MFSESEIESRRNALRGILDSHKLNALILIGDNEVSPDFSGDFRYYTNNHIIMYRQVVLLLPKEEPVLFVSSEIQRQAALRRSFIKDCRLSENIIADITEQLKSMGNRAGRVGVNFEMPVHIVAIKVKLQYLDRLYGLVAQPGI